MLNKFKKISIFLLTCILCITSIQLKIRAEDIDDNNDNDFSIFSLFGKKNTSDENNAENPNVSVSADADKITIDGKNIVTSDTATVENQNEITEYYTNIVSEMVTDGSEESFEIATSNSDSSNTTDGFDATEQEKISEEIKDDNAEKSDNSDDSNETGNLENEIADAPETFLNNSKVQIPDGMTMKEYCLENGLKLVAVIDTGVSEEFATQQVNFTTDNDADENGHGTLIAKRITDNADGEAMILSLKAFNSNGKATVANIMKALQYANDQQVDIVNMSFSALKDDNDEDKKAFIELCKATIDNSIQIVAAAGNNGTDAKDYIPASIEGVITVGAMDNKNTKIASSNYGDAVDYYEVASSTSEATGILTGKLSRNADLSKEVTNQTIKIDFDNNSKSDGNKKFTTDSMTIVFEGIATVTVAAGSWSGYTVTPSSSYVLKAPIPSGYSSSWYNCGGVSISSGGTNISGKTFSTRESSGSNITRHVACTFGGGTQSSPAKVYDWIYISNENNGTLFMHVENAEAVTGAVNSGGELINGWWNRANRRMTSAHILKWGGGNDWVTYNGTVGGRTSVSYKFQKNPILSFDSNGGSSVASATFPASNIDWKLVQSGNNTQIQWLAANPGENKGADAGSSEGYTTFKTVANPTRTGYTFKGWSLTSGRMSSNVTVQAQWTPNNYYLDLNGNLDGTSSSSLGDLATANVYVNDVQVGTNVTDFYTQYPYGSTYKIVVTPKAGYTCSQTTYTGTIGAGNVSVSPVITRATYTNTISHWTWGFKNSEGNNGSKNAFFLKNTTFAKKYKDSMTFTTGDGITPPNGFYLGSSFGSGISGSWKSYPMGTSFTQGTSVSSSEYDYYPTNYSISYNLNGGTNSSSNPSTYNVLYGVTFSNPTRKGYTFTGWYDGETKVTGINPGANASFSSADDMYNKCASRTTGNKTITAHWQASNNALTIQPDGGTYNGSTSDTTLQVPTDSNYEIKGIPTKSGYTFSGWKKSGGGSLHTSVAIAKDSNINMEEKADSDSTAYTKYTMKYTNTSSGYNWPWMRFFYFNYTVGHTYRIEYDVRVNSISGLEYANIRNSAFENNWEAPSTNLNFETGGWVHQSVNRTYTNDTVTQNGTENKVTPVIEFYCSVSSGSTGKFDFDLKNLTVYDVTTGQYVSSNNDNSKSGSFLTMSSDSSTVTAVYEANYYSVSYDTNGGTFDNAVANLNNYKIIPNGTYYISSALDSNKYVHVLNMNKNRDTRIVIHDGYGSNSYQTQWIFERYKNTPYYFIVSALSGKVLNIPGDGDICINDSYIQLWSQYDVTNSNYQDFLWYLVEDSSGNVQVLNKKSNKPWTLPDSNTANSTVIEQRTNTNGNNQKFKLTELSQNDYPSRYITMDDLTTVYANSNAPVKTGYTFAGWKSGDKVYKAGEKVNAIAGNQTLVAQWTPNKYTVTYNANGGTGTMNPDTVTYNTAYKTQKNAFTRTGYTFIGWNDSADGKGTAWRLTSDATGTYESGNAWTWTYTNNIILYAQWKANTLTINYHNDGAQKWLNYPEEKSVDASDLDVVDTDIAKYDEIFPHAQNGLLDASRFTKRGYHSGNRWKIGSKTSTTYASDTNGSFGVASATGKDVAKYLGVLDKLNAGNTTVDLYPELLPNTWTVNYSANGGIGTMEATIHTWGAGVKTHTNSFVKPGYIFQNGWYLSRVNNGKTQWLYGNTSGAWISGDSWYEEGKQPSGYIKYKVSNGQQLSECTTINNDVLTAHALWMPESFSWIVPSTITFDENSNGNTKTGIVSVTNNTLASGRKLNIKVSSDEDFKLKDTSNSANFRAYTVEKDGAGLVAGGTVLTVPEGKKTASQQVSFKLKNVTTQIAGTYQDILKFTATVN